MERLGCGGGYVCPPRPKISDLLTDDPALDLAVVAVLCNDHDDNDKHDDDDKDQDNGGIGVHRLRPQEGHQGDCGSQLRR